MGKKYTNLNSWLTVFAFAIAVNFAFARGVVAQKTDTSILRNVRSRPSKPAAFRNSLHLTLPPLKPAVISTTKINVPRPDDKLLTNVQVYPNPINLTDLINIKYTVSRNAYVNIKIMDVLGNDVATILSQRVENGDQNVSYNIGNKLSRGFYFVRIIVGTESVNKRISVL